MSASKTRRPLPSKLVHLQAQAAMRGTLNGDAAARELEQLANQGAGPDASLPEGAAPLPAAEANPTPAPAAPLPSQQPRSTAPAAEEATIPASPAIAEFPTVRPAAPKRSPRSSAKTSAQPQAATSAEAGPGISTRISPEDNREIKAAQYHLFLEHNESITTQAFLSEAIKHYLAHLRKIGKLPAKKM